MNQKITIIGAGLAGSFLAVCLGQQGVDVDVYDARPDVRTSPPDSGRSFNLTLYMRGIKAIQKIGLWDAVKHSTVTVNGNVAHFGEHEQFDPFDKRGKTVLYTVHRTALNGVLITEAEKFPNVRFHFNYKLLHIDRLEKAIYLENTRTNTVIARKVGVVIGADGVNSIVRNMIQSRQQTYHIQEYLQWGYKEVIIPHEMVRTFGLKEHATHTWPQPRSLLIAFPNHDTSFTLMFNLPTVGPNSFETLTSQEEIEKYIYQFFPKLVPALPQIIHSILNKPLGSFVTIYTNPWYYKDVMVIIGDAAHGVIPFYGQGMCAAFEDCLVLTELLKKYPDDFEKAFSEFQAKRKVNTDILGNISKENFVYLRDKARSQAFLMREKMDTALNRLFPTLWAPPLYMSIAHGTEEYAKAYHRHEKQRKITNAVGFGIAAAVLAVPFAVLQKMKKG